MDLFLMRIRAKSPVHWDKSIFKAQMWEKLPGDSYQVIRTWQWLILACVEADLLFYELTTYCLNALMLIYAKIACFL